MKPVPILFVSDSPNLPTGLARITKDLAVLTAQLPEFRVGVMGRGGQTTTKLPFAQYNFPESDQWGETHIESYWKDFAGPDKGIIFTIWDLSRLNWFSRPRMDGSLGEFLRSNKFHRWGYFPVDSYGVGGKLTEMCADTLSGYNRRLAYTMFGKQVLERTITAPIDWIPHGFNPDAFQPRERGAGRLVLRVEDEAPLVGCVMTNQVRKDWGTAFGTFAHLKNVRPGAKFWVHTDAVQRAWNIYALIEDFGLQNSVTLTMQGEHTSQDLSYMYSACDVTILPSLGEGFGFPIIESLACGIPVMHGNYGGGAELIPEESWLIEPECQRLEGPWNCVRPVWDPQKWANRLNTLIDEAAGGYLKEICTSAVEHLKWKNLWPSMWRKWLLEGIKHDGAV